MSLNPNLLVAAMVSNQLANLFGQADHLLFNQEIYIQSKQRMDV